MRAEHGLIWLGVALLAVSLAATMLLPSEPAGRAGLWGTVALCVAIISFALGLVFLAVGLVLNLRKTRGMGPPH